MIEICWNNDCGGSRITVYLFFLLVGNGADICGTVGKTAAYNTSIP